MRLPRAERHPGRGCAPSCGGKLASFCDQTLDLAGATEGAALVIAHEWNSPALIASLGRLGAGASTSRSCSTTRTIAR